MVRPPVLAWIRWPPAAGRGQREEGEVEVRVVRELPAARDRDRGDRPRPVRLLSVVVPGHVLDAVRERVRVDAVRRRERQVVRRRVHHRRGAEVALAARGVEERPGRRRPGEPARGRDPLGRGDVRTALAPPRLRRRPRHGGHRGPHRAAVECRAARECRAAGKCRRSRAQHPPRRPVRQRPTLPGRAHLVANRHRRAGHARVEHARIRQPGGPAGIGDADRHRGHDHSDGGEPPDDRRARLIPGPSGHPGLPCLSLWLSVRSCAASNHTSCHCPRAADLGSETCSPAANMFDLSIRLRTQERPC
jgi:hypothetical protein